MVSVCMITFNHERYISLALDSILSQKTNFDFEIVIADDASIDNNQKIIKQYQKKHNTKIKSILRKENIGLQRNFISAINNCNGKYIAFCEGDDYWIESDKLQKQVDFLEGNPDYAMISSDILLVNENNDIIQDNRMVQRQRTYRKPTINFFDLVNLNLVYTLTCCVRAEEMKALAERVFNEKLEYVFDYWFWLQISISNKVKLTNDKTAAYRVHKEGISRQAGYISSRIPNIKYDAIKSYCKRNYIKKANSKELYVLASAIYSQMRSKILTTLKKISLILMVSKYPPLAYQLIRFLVKRGSK